MTDLAGFHLMAKPIGPLCNLDCSYCFYLNKEQHFPKGTSFRMSRDILEAYIRDYIAAQKTQNVEFTWQGGEPLLIGIAFFETVIELQAKYAGNKAISNTLQTNGTLIDPDWADFLAQHDFLVGLSLDGDQLVNDRYRPDKQGRSSFENARRGFNLLLDRGVRVNILATVARQTAPMGREIYLSLKSLGATFIQFNPVVERQEGAPNNVTPESVLPGAYGDFLCAVFDEWLKADVGQIHVMNFEWALASWCGLPASVCLFAESCGKALILEHDGSVFSCDHFMDPNHRLGNILNQDLGELITSPFQRAFGDAKRTALPDECLSCDFLFACRGECPKNRFAAHDGMDPNLNYLCSSYKKYFRHITPAMNGMSQLIANGQDASLITRALAGPLVVVKN